MEKIKGVLHHDYHDGRRNKRALKYRLYRRTQEVLKGINTYKGNKIESLLDIGTADALMLEKLYSTLSITKPVGLDFSRDLLNKNTNSELHLVQGDAIKLPFKNESFEIIVATAVIEHVPNPSIMASECLRILKPNGVSFITTPDPFFEIIATKIGHIKEEQHVDTFNLERLMHIFEDQGFKILDAYKFMISPIGFPYEVSFEHVFKRIGLGELMLNQMVIAKK